MLEESRTNWERLNRFEKGCIIFWAVGAILLLAFPQIHITGLTIALLLAPLGLAGASIAKRAGHLWLILWPLFTVWLIVTVALLVLAHRLPA